MTFYSHLRDAFDGHDAYRFCSECDSEILSDDPVAIDFDGEYDEDGKAVDRSTYLCADCHQAQSAGVKA